eukprot:232686-Prorocentrum_minimum.AAC.2
MRSSASVRFDLADLDRCYDYSTAASPQKTALRRFHATAPAHTPPALLSMVIWFALQDASKKRGYRLVGDVDFAAVKEVAGAITPVPGGVGPMTIAMLLQNTLEGFKREVGM